MTDPAAPMPPPDRLSNRDLAARLGLNPRTIFKLRKRGAPQGTDETDWRVWCERERIRDLTPPAIDGLQNLLAAGSAGGADPDKPEAAAAAALEPGKTYSPAQLSALRTAELREEQTRNARTQNQLLDRVVIHRDDVQKTLGAFGLVVVSEMIDIPTRLVQGLPEISSADQRKLIRRAAEQLIEHARARITTDLQQRVMRLLAGGNP